jgi:hypothetical protein
LYMMPGGGVLQAAVVFQSSGSKACVDTGEMMRTMNEMRRIVVGW